MEQVVPSDYKGHSRLMQCQAVREDARLQFFDTSGSADPTTRHLVQEDSIAAV